MQARPSMEAGVMSSRSELERVRVVSIARMQLGEGMVIGYCSCALQIFMVL